jgi:hypothetical protein
MTALGQAIGSHNIHKHDEKISKNNLIKWLMYYLLVLLKVVQ